MDGLSFNISLYGQLQKISETISSCRVRIFYKGGNRNSTYITDEFAKKLISTLAYAPIKGIYDSENKDYTDHGKERTEGRIYGIVPVDHNFNWEDYEDDDGITRTYACADVYLFTALYPEASEIIGKPQSMEIYAKSIKGQWEIIDNKRQFVYTEGCFLGLQALGEEVTPCFEGAEFFTMYTNLKNLFQIQEGGKEKMLFNFKLSDSAKHSMLFNLLNPNCNEAGGWIYEYSICDVYDDYALCYNYEEKAYYRCNYQKDDTKDEVTLGDIQKCFIVDVTEAEYQALNLLKAANEGSFEKVDEVFAAASQKIDELSGELNTANELVNEKEEAITGLNTTLTEKDQAIAGLNTVLEEKDTAIEAAEAIVQEKDSTIETLTGELSSLKSQFEETQKEQKEGVIAQYTGIVEADVLAEFTSKLAEFTIIDLRKELAFLAVESNPSIFTKNEPGLIPSLEGTDNLSGASKLLMKHNKKK